MPERKVYLNEIDKLYAFVNIMQKFDLKVDACSDDYVLNAKSIFGIMSLDLSRPITIKVHSTSEEAQELFDAITDYIIL